jgi:hypothetical protein
MPIILICGLEYRVHSPSLFELDITHIDENAAGLGGVWVAYNGREANWQMSVMGEWSKSFPCRRAVAAHVYKYFHEYEKVIERN